MGRMSVFLIACCAVVIGAAAARFLSLDVACDLDSGGYCTCADGPASTDEEESLELTISDQPGSLALDDVIALSAAGVSDEIVVNQIHAAEDAPLLSTADLLTLHQRGVSERVIVALQHRRTAVSVEQDEPRPLIPSAAHASDICPAPCASGERDLTATQSAVAALATKRDVIANNLANVHTVAFKRSRVMLADLGYRHVALPGAQDATSQLTAVGVSVGQGTSVQGVQTDFSQGPLMQTGGELDLAIEGHGFFQILDTNGQFLYTRAGNFAINDQGTVVVGSSTIGRVLQPQLQIPVNATSVTITAEGIVAIIQAGNPLQQQIGQLQLAQFQNSQGLLKVGENMYSETIASGPVQLQNPGVNGIGRVRQRMLEGSNVDAGVELAEMKRTCAALSANERLLHAANDVPRQLNRLDSEHTAAHEAAADDRAVR